MTAATDSGFLEEASGLIAERLGLSFPKERWPDLARGLESAGAELGLEYPGACMRWLRSSDAEDRRTETLASHLTVGETYFYRDPDSFAALEADILPRLISKRAHADRTLRLWSAGCCTGEEAYSLAMACMRALPDYREWNVFILATDINPKFLSKAEAGVYGEWSFRGVPASLRERFFSPARGGKFEIDPEVKKLVHFAYLNLAKDVYPSIANYTNAMDVIFCRNVLMYFTLSHQKAVVAGLHRCLAEGAYLLVNPAEASDSLFPMFAMEKIGGTAVYRKSDDQARVESRPEFGFSATGAQPPALEPRAPAAVSVAARPAPSALRETPAARSAVPAVPAVPAEPAGLPAAPALASARGYADQGRLEEALAACREAIAADRVDPTARFLFAAICQELGRTEEAIAGMVKTLYLDQDFILAHYALGGLYRHSGKRRESGRHFATALKILSAKSKDEAVPESGGMSCGRLIESIRAAEES
jgi:chemotaxis protein methyltransferase CheR